MIKAIYKECKHEVITYKILDDYRVLKKQVSKIDTKEPKSKIIKVTEIKNNRTSFKNTQEFFENKILKDGYQVKE